MKILQWLFGSFFRTIGRTIAILVMGGLLYYILSINGIGISDLFLDKVDALSLDGIQTGLVQVRTSTCGVRLKVEGGEDTETYNCPFEYYYQNTDNDYLVFNYSSVTSIENHIQDLAWFMSRNDVNLNIILMSNNGGNNKSCEVQNNMIVCPMNHNATYTNLYFSVWFANLGSSDNFFDISLEITNYPMKYKTNSQAIIDNQNQNTQSLIQQQQNATNQILDDNTTQADNTGKDFITNFSNNTHGLTGIITAPLNAIQSLSSATCSPLVLPLPFTNNKTLTLPCMSSVYSQYFGAFYTMYQGIILGLISYWVCVRIFALAKGFKDPEDDKIEVVDL